MFWQLITSVPMSCNCELAIRTLDLVLDYIGITCIVNLLDNFKLAMVLITEVQRGTYVHLCDIIKHIHYRKEYYSYQNRIDLLTFYYFEFIHIIVETTIEMFKMSQ